MEVAVARYSFRESLQVENKNDYATSPSRALLASLRSRLPGLTTSRLAVLLRFHSYAAGRSPFRVSCCVCDECPRAV